MLLSGDGIDRCAGARGRAAARRRLPAALQRPPRRPVAFTLPHGCRARHGGWCIDTADEPAVPWRAQDRMLGGASYPLQGRSLALLRRDRGRRHDDACTTCRSAPPSGRRRRRASRCGRRRRRASCSSCSTAPRARTRSRRAADAARRDGWYKLHVAHAGAGDRYAFRIADGLRGARPGLALQSRRRAWRERGGRPARLSTGATTPGAAGRGTRR